MKKTYRAHLCDGVTIKFKADDVIVKWNEHGYTEWKVVGAKRWFTFFPKDLVAIERIR